MHLHHFRCFEEHMRMLFQSLSALCKAPGGAESIWEYLEAVVRATRVSGRFAYGFRTELHFADEACCGKKLFTLKRSLNHSQVGFHAVCQACS
jgi:hypothetical protein